ncbi:hypothetical protein Tco_1447000 [Tanacetum coccineum]
MSSDDDAKKGNRDHTNSPMIAEPKLKIGDEFLKILRDNAFNGMDGSDVIDHIEKVLEITEWIKVPNMDKNELRLHVLSKSLSGDAEEWWNNEIEGSTTTWNKLGEIYDFVESNRDYSPIPIPARNDISNPDELCKSEEFTVNRYSIGSSKEFVTVGSSGGDVYPCKAYDRKLITTECLVLYSNYRVFCEDMLKGAQFGAKMKIFEDYLFLDTYVVSDEEDTTYQR